ncbi:MAG: M48 family metalloprotease [bacterium]
MKTEKPGINYKIIYFISFTLVLLLLVCLQSPAYSSSIPVQRLTPEVEIGRKVYEQIKPHLKFTRNPLIKYYLEKIGNNILDNLPRNDYEFRFFPIKANDINAFALPNGYIFVTNRLIQACDSEDELAFVLCHEIAHVMRGHFMNYLSQKRKTDMTTLALIVLGALAAQDRDLQEALPALGLGINQNITLSYSRGQEYEADTYGLRYLHQAGFSEEGAAQFMNKLRILSQITISLPVYLSTHPMPVDRLVNLKRFTESSSCDPSRPCISNINRLKLWCRLETELSDRLLSDLTPVYSHNPDDIDTVYGLALVYEKLGSSDEAEKYYMKGLSINPEDGDVLRDYAIFLYRRALLKDAEDKLKLAIKSNPEDPLAHHYLGRILMDQKRNKEAIDEFLKSVEVCSGFPDNHHFLGILYSQQGDEEKSHKSFERYFALIGNQKAARLHSQKKERISRRNEEE